MTNDSAKPIKQDDFGRPTPINDARLAALEELSALDQELELKYGIAGNPMIKAEQRTPPMQPTPGEGSKPREGTEPVAWALIATDGAIAGDVLAVTTTRELAFRKFVNSHQPCKIVPLIVAPQDCATAGREGQNTRDQQQRTKEAATMSDTNERSVASAGSVADKPVAWATLFCGGPLVVSRFKQICDDEAHYQGDVATVIPLYRSPTLTDEERYAIDTAMHCCRIVAGPMKLNLKADEAAATLRGLLERLGGVK